MILLRDEKLETIVKSRQQTGQVSVERFIDAVKELIALVSTTDDFSRAYELIRFSIDEYDAPPASYIQALHERGNEYVPEKVYNAVQKAIRHTKTEFRTINRRRAENSDQESKNIKEWHDELNNKSTYRTTKMHKVNGNIPLFALKAIVSRIIQDGIYDTIEDLDEAFSIKKGKRNGIVKKALKKGDECSESLYSGLINIIHDHEGRKYDSIPRIKEPIAYEPSGQYALGQTIIFDESIGTVTRRLPKDKIEVKMLTGETRRYRERYTHDRHYKNECICPLDLKVNDIKDESVKK